MVLAKRLCFTAYEVAKFRRGGPHPRLTRRDLKLELIGDITETTVRRMHADSALTRQWVMRTLCESFASSRLEHPKPLPPCGCG